MIPPRPRKRLRASIAIGTLVAGGLAVGCEEEAVPIIGIAHPTLVQVAPRAFLGELPCMDAPGAMRRYVATVYDVHYADGGVPEGEGGAGGAGAEPLEFALPSSTIDRGDGVAVPVPCTQSVGFARVVVGHQYRAEIDGYDRDDLVALASGLRVLNDPVTGDRVDPRWTIRCGDMLPVTSIEAVTRTIEECKLVSDSAPESETLVLVSIDDALDVLECGTEAGTVERYEVELPDGQVERADCGESITLPGLESGPSTLTLELRAFEAGETSPTWGTQCIADVVEGVTTTANCLPLAATGALEVDPEDALGVLGLECKTSSFVLLELELEGSTEPPIELDSRSCSRPVNFLGLDPGSATVRATARLLDGSASAVATCTAAVVPGTTVPAPCALEP